MKNVLEVCYIVGQKIYLQIPLGSGSTLLIQNRIRIHDTSVVDPDPIISITCIPIRIRVIRRIRIRINVMRIHNTEDS